MAKHAAPRTRYRWWFPTAVVIVAAALVATILTMDRTGGTADRRSAPEPRVTVTAVDGPQQSGLDDFGAADDTDPLADGPVDAPVTLVVFSDYQCPYCAAWSQDTLPVMLDYVDSGDLRIVWREVNVFGPASEQAAKAAYAAALQGKHWQFHDALFAGGRPRPSEQLSAEALTAVAQDLGLDIDRFTTDMRSEETAEAVADNAAEGTDLGAFSTPAFILDGQPYVGAQPTDVFVDAVEAAKKGQN